MSRLYFQELDLSRETVDIQMTKVAEEYDELVAEMRTDLRDPHRIYSEDMDLVQATLGLLRIMRRIGCGDEDTQAHYTKLARRSRRIVGNTIIDEAGPMEMARLRAELRRERDKVNTAMAALDARLTMTGGDHE